MVSSTELRLSAAAELVNKEDKSGTEKGLLGRT